MAADRREAVTLVLQQIFRDEPGITAAETLLEFARRSADGRNLRIKREEAVDFLRGKGRYQVYKRVPVEWEGTISKHPQTDTRFDLDIADLRTQSAAVPDQMGYKFVMLMQDRFSCLVGGLPMETRQVPQLIATFNALLASMSQSAEPGIGIEVNADEEMRLHECRFPADSSKP